ncbi:hypothetical protein EDB84DRAFT_1478366 [Lactarius hengduanensis]|nr:hypothetical protein EDB84DRAFT_1478366 [Lactarius hengduanensis]
MTMTTASLLFVSIVTFGTHLLLSASLIPQSPTTLEALPTRMFINGLGLLLITGSSLFVPSHSMAASSSLTSLSRGSLVLPCPFWYNVYLGSIGGRCSLLGNSRWRCWLCSWRCWCDWRVHSRSSGC